MTTTWFYLHVTSWGAAYTRPLPRRRAWGAKFASIPTGVAY